MTLEELKESKAELEIELRELIAQKMESFAYLTQTQVTSIDIQILKVGEVGGPELCMLNRVSVCLDL